MKNLYFLTALVLGFALAAVPTSTLLAQLNTNGNCGPVVVSGCFGDCGGSNTFTYTVATSHPGVTKMCLENTGNNLCGNFATTAIVKLNGATIRYADLKDPGSGTKWQARAGDVIEVTILAFQDPKIFCIVGGEFSYALHQLH